MRLAIPTLFRDALIVGIAGLAVGLAANALSPRGISLQRDYFRTADRAAPQHGTTAGRQNEVPASRAPAFPRVADEDALALFHDPRFSEQRIVFVDARREEDFAAGHIPGAQPFDHYHPERHTTDILASTALAERIVVYCNGGNCEDSDLAAQDLVDLGVPREKIVVYAGGINAWKARHQPVEPGSAPASAVRP